MQIRTSVAASLAFLAATAAHAAIVGFTENFTTDSANWRNAGGVTPLTWSAAGGPLGGSFASSTFNLSTTTSGGFPPTVIRAHASYPSSGGAYVGNWITEGATGVVFQFRHNLPEAVFVTGRFASPQNFPGASVLSSAAVQAGVWTTVSFNLTEGSNDIISLGGSTYAAIFSNIGNMQFGFNVSPTLAGQNIDGTFDIANFQIVPAPGALALIALAGLVTRRRR
ncbi:MAG: hypothetical protein LW636_01785 [Planctomycetaceae bacterium]|nr:hypothetical protein [Planctomycetaceae bacterium]